MGNNGNSDGLCFLGPQNNYSHEIKRRLLLRRKAMTQLESIVKRRGITLLTKARGVRYCFSSGKFLEMAIPVHLTCLLRNLYAGQEATVRTGHGITDWLQIGKGVHHGCISSLCLFNLYAEYLMRNAGLDEAQAGIKIAGRNINNLRYADDTTLMAEKKN